MQSFNEADESESSIFQHVVAMRHGARMQPSNPNWLRVSMKKHWDMPLAPGYQQECGRKASQLAGTKFDLVCISPFLRCAQTAAAIIPHLDLAKSCKIFFHRGLSEVHSIENLFPRAEPPSISQRFAFWRWCSKREHVLPEFTTMGKHTVQHRVLGEWPKLPETLRQAQARYLAALTEALELAQEGNVLLITHAEGVEQLVHWQRPGSQVEEVEYLGHSEVSRLLYRGDDSEELNEGSSEGEARVKSSCRSEEDGSWQLVQPPKDLCGQKAQCGVTLVPERVSSEQRTSKWQCGRLQEAALDDKMRMAMSSNAWWAMTD